ncbi:MAG: Inosine-5'-monophosphate dehydrogenase [Parcubacteria group bacterium GW2011_GWC2_45_7]|nr:MAG: Inosine-5'-monophosphate dehydrogenase [Parcubacteria group bacterium GW2011_GWC2_45_7]
MDRLINDYFKAKGLPVTPALTFEDITIVDKFSDIPTRSAIKDTRGRLAQNMYLNAPIISANMDTITESAMAIALARLGGIGFIHQFLPIDKRCQEIERVKRADSGIVEKPLLGLPSMTLKEAKSRMKLYNISSLLVVDEKTKKLVGILSHRDYQFERDESKRITDLMTRTKLVTALYDISLEKARAILSKHKVEKLPLVDKAGRLRGLMTTKDIQKTLEFPIASRDRKGRLLVGGTVGIGNGVIDEVEALLNSEIDVIMIDTARGNSKRMIEIIMALRKKFGKQVPFVAGNVDTVEGAVRLIEAGVDCVKVGIGGGSACKTRMGPGIGLPQITAVAQCAALAQHYGIPIIADGGIKNSSDFCKALAVGASGVMLGGLLSGTEETPGRPFYEDGEKWKIYRGSASLEFQLSRIDRDESDAPMRTPEGVPKRVRYKGEARFVVDELMGHLRSSMSYVGAWTLEEYHEKATCVWQTTSGFAEGKPHEVA